MSPVGEVQLYPMERPCVVFSALAKAALEQEDAEVFLQAPWWADKGDEAQAKIAFGWRKKLQTALHLPRHWEDVTDGVADELRAVAQDLAEIEKASAPACTTGDLVTLVVSAIAKSA